MIRLGFKPGQWCLQTPVISGKHQNHQLQTSFLFTALFSEFHFWWMTAPDDQGRALGQEYEALFPARMHFHVLDWDNVSTGTCLHSHPEIMYQVSACDRPCS
jgi:hypothetical protein